jgi:hypothetical protein
MSLGGWMTHRSPCLPEYMYEWQAGWRMGLIMEAPRASPFTRVLPNFRSSIYEIPGLHK